MSKLRVLIADDKRPARLFLKNLLNGFEDVEVLGEAKDGAEVLDLIKEIKPNLLFLDLQMPVLSGLEVFKLLPENSAFFVVFVTADEDKTTQISKAGSVEYLLKPVTQAELRAIVNSVKKIIIESQNI